MIKRIAGYVMTALMVFSLCACGQYETVTGPQKQQYDIELSDIVLYDNNDITITAKGFNYSGEIGATLCIEIFNNSDIDIGVVAGLNFSVNGITGIPVITDNNGHTLSGQTKLFNMSIFDSELESANISEIHSMGVILNIDKYDGNTCMGILDTSDLIELNLSTSDILFNENGVKITYVNYEEGVNFYEANFIIENNTQSDVTIIHYGYVNSELREILIKSDL